MTQEDIIARAKQLIRLRDRTDSSGEAQAAAKALAQLLDKHRLEEAELELSEDGERRDGATEFAVDDKPLFTCGRSEPWRIELAAVLAKHYSVAVWRRKFLGKLSIHMCGRPDDVAIFREMYQWLSADIPRLCSIECKGLTTAERYSWRCGFVFGLTKQLAEARAMAVAERPTQTAAMVLVKRGEEADAYVRKLLGSKLKSARTPRIRTDIDHDSMARGFEAGYKRHVGRQVKCP